MLVMNLQVPIVLSLQPHQVQYQAVPLLEQGAATAGPPPTPVLPPSRHVYHITPSPPPQHQRSYQPEMVAGKAPPPSKFRGNMKGPEGWILQMDDYFTITQTRNEIQRLAYIGLYTKGDALEWWKSNKHRFNIWAEVKDAIREYYGDHYKPDSAFNEINDVKQTGTVRKYLNNMDRLNVYTKMTEHHLMNISLNGIIPHLRQAMAHYDDLRSKASKWK